VIACHNEASHIREFLDSILAQDRRNIDCEVIIADGISEDGTREILDQYAKEHPEIRIVSNPGKIVSTGLNAAIRAARGEYILRMDAHTFYAPDYLRRCIETLIRTGAQNAGGPARTRARGNIGEAVAAAYHSRFSTGGARFHDVNFEGWVDTVPYGCWRKNTLLKLGLFNESLVRNQDDELNLRMTRSGGKIWQDPAIVSWYSPRSTLSGLFRQYMQYGFWKVAVIRIHKIPGSIRHLVPAAFVLANVVLPILWAVCALAGARHASIFAALCWLAMLGIYFGGTLAATFEARRKAAPASLPYLPLVFATYHLSYGVGFLAGLLRFRSKQNVAGDSAFSRISR
jgi:glycosyltransferase involved in cell wall biosynthesis